MAWNVRGAFNKTSRVHMKNLVNNFKPSVLILMEIHGSYGTMQVFWEKLGFNSIGMMDGVGHRGGI